VLFRPQVEIIRATVKQGTSFDFVCAGGGEAVRSQVAKRSIVIAGHKTSVSIEDEFWNSLKEIARERSATLTELVTTIHGNRQHANLSSAIRLFVLGVYRDRSLTATDTKT
jgi:predicted DNA-binding ribbon-helix-helix protein